MQPQPQTHPHTPSDSNASANRLVSVWIWIPIAILGAMFAAPADFILIRRAMAYALPCFFIGVAWGAGLSDIAKWTLIAFCSLIAGSIAVITWASAHQIFILIAVLFTVANIALGFKSVRAVPHHRLRVFIALALAYVPGLLLGPLCIILFTVPAVWIANRYPRA